MLFNSGRGSRPEAQPDSCSSSSAAKALISCFIFVFSLLPLRPRSGDMGVNRGADKARGGKSAKSS